MTVEKIHELAKTCEQAAAAIQQSKEPEFLTLAGHTLSRGGKKIVTLAEALEPEPPPPPPGGGFEAEEPSNKVWLTEIPQGLPAGWHEGKWQKTLSTGFGANEPTNVTGVPQLKGVWTRALSTSSWGEDGTLWHHQGYNAHGVIDGLDLWGIGDFVRGREGHGLYERCVPTLDMTIRNYHCYLNGGQAVQREWRRGETNIPEPLWRCKGNGGDLEPGVFTLEDCDMRETGLIDERRGGLSVRASWANSLFNTGQHTVVQRVRHHNYYSPSPHEGSLLIGYGTDRWRGPSARISDNDFYCRSNTWGPTVKEQDHRPIIFIEGQDAVVIERTHLRGEDNYIDLVDDCYSAVVREMPQDTTVRIKAAGATAHGQPIQTFLVAAGASVTFTRKANGGMGASVQSVGL